jgi:hypothetical protein
MNLAIAYAHWNSSRDALAAAEKALKLAQAENRTAEIRAAQTWLNSYRASLPKLPPSSNP